MTADQDAERLLQELADPLHQLVSTGEAEREVERLCTDLERCVRRFLDRRLPDAAAVLEGELLDPARVLPPALAAWFRSFADGLDGGAT